VVGEFYDVQSGKDDIRPELTKALDLAKRTRAKRTLDRAETLEAGPPEVGRNGLRHAAQGLRHTVITGRSEPEGTTTSGTHRR
jgi:hypothetical protein